MNFLPFALLITIFCCNRSFCNSITTTESDKMVRRSSMMSVTKKDENRTEGKQMPWRVALFPTQNPIKIEELKKIANTKDDSSNRRTKFLGSLALLAGLANAATATTKNYIRSPPVPPNPDITRLSPHIATVYDPHIYIPHPYIVATPLGVYPLLNLLRLQSIGGVQNDFQTLTQNPQVSNLLEEKKPLDLLNNDKYMDETKRVENVKTSSSVQDEADEREELQVENDRNAEEKVAPGTACDAQKKFMKKQGNPKVLEDEDEDEDFSARLIFRATKTTTTARALSANQIAINTTTSNTTSSSPTTSSSLPTVIDVTETSTMNSTEAVTPPLHGYYGGYPQSVNNIEFTTAGQDYKYQDYDHVNYNLPSYEKPANFYSDDKYNYYSNPSADGFPSNQFQQDQIPEFLSSDFNRFLYTPDNTPPFINAGFRPVA
ncbi:uncharacterized protein LOC143187125 [Calliopsis andreniformis]|uniref:uncharacterized protein LOC143187125 n=1 Tax=Calliopsis andreniformis TaxID=337506 RepID=UPI003FCE643F